MKKKKLTVTILIIALLLILLTIVCIIIKHFNKQAPSVTNAEKATVNHLAYDHSSNYVYSGFSDIPEEYSAEDAKADNCFVIKSDGTSSAHIQYSSNDTIIYGTEHWQSFLDKVAANEDAFLRVAHFIGSDYSAFSDLYYSDGQYYLYEKDEYGVHKTGPNKYLRMLEGTDGIPPKDSYFYVLTDSLELSFEDVRHAMFASDLRTVTEIPYKWLGFTTYLD